MKRTVEIAGAGIAGLTVGLAFAQKGWRVRVHEQLDALRGADRGIHLWQSGLRVLDALGVLDPAIAGALGTERQERRNYDGTTFSSSRLGQDFPLHVLLRECLLATLHDALIETGGEVVFNSRAIAAQPDGWLCFADGSSLRADLVVGADGVNSTIRDSLGLLRWRHTVNQFGYRTLVPREPNPLDGEAGCTHVEYWNGSRRLLYMPVAADLAHVQLTSLAGDSAGNTVPIDQDFWRSLFPDQARIIDCIPTDGSGEWFEIVRLEQWSSGRAAIIGDAAIAQPPFLGHGAGCSLMSAFALARAVDGAGDVIQGLVEWELHERPFTEWVQWVAYWYGQLAFLAPRLRTAVLRAIDQSDWAKRRILLAATRRDVTAMRFSPPSMPSPTIYPLIH
jgi:2-polyprenyl-6-methoxyphenol hydroxylase-like FAD-dependent oxidoreductase